MRAELVILFCELTASPNLYTLENNTDHLLNNASELLKNLLSVCRTEEESHIFSYYEEKLRKDCWKRQLGAVHGYVRFMEVNINSVPIEYCILMLIYFSNVIQRSTEYPLNG